MRKLVVSVPDRQHEFLDRFAKVTGLPKAEVIRRILDDYIIRSQQDKRNERGFDNGKEN